MPALLAPLAIISPRIDGFLHDHGVLALFLLVFLQDIGVPTGLPGTVLVLIGGYLVYSHVVGLHEAAIAIALGAFLGASGMFFLARYGGRPLVLRLGRFVGLTAKRLDAAALALDRWGPPMLLITRVAPGTRVYMTIFAGISGWTYRRFALWTALFAVLWAYGFVLLGAALGTGWVRVGRDIGRFSFILLFAAFAVIALYYGVRLLVSHPRTKDSGVALAVGRVLQWLRLQRFVVATSGPVLEVAEIGIANVGVVESAADGGEGDSAETSPAVAATEAMSADPPPPSKAATTPSARTRHHHSTR
jgi:membrane protein DedA with SNARE-associated domain